MNRCLWLLVALAIVTCGCSSTLYVQAHPGHDQGVRFEAGYPVLSSEKINSVVMTPVYSPIENKLMFYIAVANFSLRPFVLSQDIVTASSGVWGDELRLWSRDDIVKKIERAAFWQTVAVALGAAADSYNASQPSTTTASGTYSGYGSSGYVSGTYYGSFTTYDPAASAAAQAMIRANATQQLESIATVASARRSSVQSIVTMDTIDPGDYRGGYLLVDIPKRTGSTPKPVTFVIKTPSDMHIFDFSVYRN